MVLSDGDSAAATIAATMKPATPPDRCVTMNVGRILSGTPQRRHGGVLVVGEQQHADRQEEHELGEHDDTAEHESQAGLARRARRQQPLDKILVSTVRRERQGHATDDARPQRVDFLAGTD